MIRRRNFQGKTVIGVTGLIGAGKTEFSGALKRPGIAVINVDRFARSLYKRHSPLYRRLVRK